MLNSEDNVPAIIPINVNLPESTLEPVNALIDADIDSLYAQLMLILHGEPLTLVNITSIVRKLIELVDESNKDGLEKKALVVAVLKRFVLLNMPGDESPIIDYILNTLPSVIDELANLIKKLKSLHKPKWCCNIL